MVKGINLYKKRLYQRNVKLSDYALPYRLRLKLIFMPTYEREKSRYHVTRDNITRNPYTFKRKYFKDKR